MTFKTIRVFAACAALLAGGAIAAQAAPDDQIKYRDGQPVQGGSSAGMDAPTGSMAAPSKAKKHMAGKKSHTMAKGKHMKKGGKRSPSVKHLRGHSETPRSKM